MFLISVSPRQPAIHYQASFEHILSLSQDIKLQKFNSMTLFNPTVRFSPALLSRGIKPFQKNIDIIENLYSVFCPRGRHRVQRACPVSVVDIGKERYSSMTGLKLGIGSDDMVSQNNKVAMDPFSSSSTIFSPQVFQKIL